MPLDGPHQSLSHKVQSLIPGYLSPFVANPLQRMAQPFIMIEKLQNCISLRAEGAFAGKINSKLLNK